MVESDATARQGTGIEGAAAVFSAAAFVNVALSLVLLRAGWLGEVGAFRFLFLGLELAAAAVTTAAVALALGPYRGAASRKAWIAAGAALLLVGVVLAILLPVLLDRGGVPF